MFRMEINFFGIDFETNVWGLIHANYMLSVEIKVTLY